MTKPPVVLKSENGRVVKEAARPDCGWLIESEAFAVLRRGDESLHHVRGSEVPIEGVEFVQPERITAEVRVGRIVWISAQITEVLHQHECPIELLGLEYGVVYHRPEHVSATLRSVVCRQLGHQGV